MSDSYTRTKAELLDEIRKLRERIDLLESTASEHQHVVARLRDSERKRRAWLDHSPVCTKIVDLDFKLQYMSKAGIESLRIGDIKNYYGKPYPFKFYPKSFRDQMTGNLNRAKKTGEITVQEGSVVDIYGKELCFHSTIVPVNDDSGMVDYIMIVSIDITQGKQAEYRLQQLNIELEKRVASRTQELEEANRQLTMLSETDALTNIANRRVYERRLSEEFVSARRTNQPLSLLLIDIDHFKQYNDNYGHDYGDIALRRVAKILQNSLSRATDLVARLGGEEFVVLLPGTNAEGASAVAEKIRSNIQSTRIEHLYSSANSVLTVSIGISTQRDREISGDEILQQADLALYKSKNNGRNRIELFEDNDWLDRSHNSAIKSLLR